MFFTFLYYGSMVILIPGLLFAVYAQIRVKTTYSKYSRMHSSNNWTASDCARMLLEKGDCPVVVQRVEGHLTDNYNPKTQILSLSEGVYDSTSVAAIGIAAHEVGHAMQHNENYLPLKFRSFVVPVVNIGSYLAIPLAIIGLIVEWLAGTEAMLNVGETIVSIAIFAYSLTFIFSLITLPVEFNASHRAGKLLAEYGVLTKEENGCAKKVLYAAALTYVAALVVSFLYLLRFVMILSSFRRRK